MDCSNRPSGGDLFVVAGWIERRICMSSLKTIAIVTAVLAVALFGVVACSSNSGSPTSSTSSSTSVIAQTTSSSLAAQTTMALPTATWAPTPTPTVEPKPPAQVATEATKPKVQPTPTAKPAPTPTPKPKPTPTPTPKPTGPPLTPATVTRVVDGDTLVVNIDGKSSKLRLIGMDTPETVDPSRPVMCFGHQATEETQRLVDQANGKVLLEKDVSETDKYGRLLRYVWLLHPDGRRMLNQELVKSGFARSYTYPPDVRYAEIFRQEEQRARAAGKGLWGACSGFDVPVATQATSTAASGPAQTANAAVTASISNPSPTARSLVTVSGKITVDGQPVAGVPMTATWHYKTTTSTCNGESDASGVASCTRNIGRPTKGYTVRVDLTFSWQGKTFRAQTSFTPR